MRRSSSGFLPPPLVALSPPSLIPPPPTAVVVCIVSDGRAKINARTLSVLAAMGVYQDGVAKNEVAGKPVTAHIYEYTTQREAFFFFSRRPPSVGAFRRESGARVARPSILLHPDRLSADADIDCTSHAHVPAHTQSRSTPT